MASVLSPDLRDQRSSDELRAGAVRAGSRRRSSGTEIRPEIQALRAVAVGLVVIYHLWPKAVPGGFVGVDVFFAISGFLITSHLFRELDGTGTVSLGGFWARRARRILPAALTVLLVCAIATIAVVPQGSWSQFLGEIRAATTYTQNWHLAADAVDYLAAENAPSPVQHFWSLSAEEQFYLVWPVLILGAAALAGRRTLVLRRRTIAVTLWTITLASLAFSIHDTSANPAAAYFITPTRAWEFGLGGLLALVGSTEGVHAGVRSVVSWLGLAAIAVAAFAYTGATPFPGYQAALPVLGAVAVMWARAPERRWAPTPAARLRPVQFLGDISYSVYLWHWPLLILAPFALDHTAGTGTKVGVLAATLAGAWLTKVVVEDPVRRTPRLTRRPSRVTFAAVAVGTAVVIGATVIGNAMLDSRLHHDEQVSQGILSSKPKCFGAAARDPQQQPCDDPKLRTAVVPTPVEAEKADNAPCTMGQRIGLISPCAFGAPPGGARQTIALIGDSHASHWRAALAVVARRERWHGISVTHTGCAFSLAFKDYLVEPERSECRSWVSQVPKWLAAHPEIHTIFISEKSGGTVPTDDGESQMAAQEAGFLAAWRTLPSSVRHVVIIRDTARAHGSTADCVQRAMDRHQPAGTACSMPRSYSLLPDPAARAAKRLGDDRFSVVDLNRFICDDRRCYPVVGGALVYKDSHHMTSVFATTLGPYLQRAVDRALRVPGAAAGTR
ncbi:MAG TPA: acyltransferase family protein [Baekduia sp.]|nr:acyltransferase family protein [Baekduia sp.]